MTFSLCWISVFKTSVGALSTIFVLAVLLIYTIYNFHLMLFFLNSKNTKMTFYRTLADDLSPRNISSKGFDIAVDLIDLEGKPFLLTEYFQVEIH